MFKKITWFTFCFLLSLLIVNTDRAEKIINNFFEYYPLEYPESNELSFCSSKILDLLSKWDEDGPPIVDKYISQYIKSRNDAELVLAYKKEIDKNLIGTIDFYFNNDEGLTQDFQEEFNLYIEKNNIATYSNGHIYQLQLKYLLDNNNENALYVCDILNDIFNYDYTVKRHREVLDLISNIKN